MSTNNGVLSKRDLLRLRSGFVASVCWSYLAAPLAAYTVAILYGLPPQRFAAVAGLGLATVVVSTLFAMVAVWHFTRFLDPLLVWMSQHPGVSAAPPHIHQQLRRFTKHFWGLHIAYALMAPGLFHAVGVLEVAQAQSLGAVVAHFVGLQLVVALLLGLPAYLMGLNALGNLVAWIGLDAVHVSLRHKLLLQIGFLPAVGGGILAQYYWWTQGSLSPEAVLLWAGLGVVTLGAALLSVRSLDRALDPLHQVLADEGGATSEDFSRLRPCSVDELGYLTQTLARLFRRLRDQDAEVHAVVENAAEGIVVVDEIGRIERLNRAAEELFGYRACEVKNRPLAWLLPSLVNAGGMPEMADGEQVVDGVHNRGRKIPMSVRMSRTVLSGRVMFIILVADISDRKAAEKKLRDAEARYRHLVETAHDLVWSMDLQARWTYLNKAAKAIYGYEPHEMIGRPVRDYQRDDYGEQDFVAFKEILTGRELVQYETAHVDRHGNVHNLSFNAKAFRDADGRIVGISGTARDITEQKAVERQLAYQAQHDALTGLGNRRQFQEELERVVARVARSAATCALLYIDLDQFKYINDTLGHAAGDRLLVEFSQLLKSHLRESDMLARFGGDEFTVLVYNVDVESATRVAENLRAKMDAYRFLAQGHVYNIGCSIGVAMIDSTIDNVDDCMAHADLACHLAKNQGRNCVHVYRAEDGSKLGMEADIGWAARVKDTLERDRMELVFQPIMSLADGSVRDYEVLARMLCDNGQVILPGGFMPAAERFGLSASIDRWMVNRAITELATLHSKGDRVRFAVNLSPRAFDDGSLLDLIRNRLAKANLDPSALTFEITETAAIGNMAAAIEFITALKKIGCQFALDDFGSGFSSFIYLKHLPVDKLKIDGSFVQNMVGSSVDQAMVQSMAQVARALGKATVAEFVENRETLELLAQFGIDYAQGFYLGKPVNRPMPFPPKAALQVAASRIAPLPQKFAS
jgi:diguanylate cyclase (GGDEF)-like protein/PAS domain S-box-containing protein